MKATAGATALPPSLQQRNTKRRSDRHKKQERRAKARKVLSLGDNEEFRTALWVDALEGVDPAGAIPEEDEEYDELDELEAKNKRKRGARGKAASKSKIGVLPKRLHPRSLATILIEEAGRNDGTAREFLNAEACLPENQQLPPRKFCPVTGLEGLYTEPKSKIPFSSMKALEQIRERSPPWMTLSGTAAYSDAVKSIRNEV